MKSLSGTVVLITGGTGSFGNRVARHLLKAVKTNMIGSQNVCEVARGGGASTRSPMSTTRRTFTASPRPWAKRRAWYERNQTGGPLPAASREPVALARPSGV